MPTGVPTFRSGDRLFRPILAIPSYQNITQMIRIPPHPKAWIGATQNPSVLATRASRKATRFSVCDAKCKSPRSAIHRASMGAPELQRHWPEMRKPLGKPGVCSTGFRKLTDRTGTELLGVFPMVLGSSKGAWCLKMDC